MGAMFKSIASYVGEVCEGWVGGMSALFGLILSILGWFFIPDATKIKPYVVCVGVVALLYAFYRAWARKNAELNEAVTNLNIEQERSRPLFEGAIDSQQAGPIHRMSGGLEGSYSGCGIMIVVHFANNRPVPTSIVALRLRVRIGETSHEAFLTEKRSGYVLIFRDMYGHEDLRERLKTVANQGDLFAGYLQFTLTDVLIKDSDHVIIEALLIEDTFGLRHEIRPQGDGYVELHLRPNLREASARSMGNAPPRLAQLVPPLILEPIKVSSELTALVHEVFSPARGSACTSRQSQGQTGPS
jgi:hypothetical protein